MSLVYFTVWSMVNVGRVTVNTFYACSGVRSIVIETVSGPKRVAGSRTTIQFVS